MACRTVFAAVLCATLLLSGCKPGRTAVQHATIDPQELQAFADSFFPEQMEALRIPGVSFIFVQDGTVVYAQGYGYADLAAGTPMSPNITVVRIGSISKPFVATAVMQLVEQGKLNLKADINQYLTTFQLKDSYTERVTLAQLLTHTAGYEDPPYSSNIDPALVQPLDTFLAANMPPRTHAPGKEFTYSSYGFALAALVVEQVSGTPFDQYCSEHIFGPLGMSHTRYLVAPPAPENMATGYAYQNDAQVAQPLDYDDDYPGGSVISTAEDMSHFVLAHLQGGRYGSAQILQADTLEKMHAQHATTPYEGQNVAYGFVRAELSGQLLLGHAGSIRGFGASLDLLPEHDAGYFFAFNEECIATSACDLVSGFREQLLERFFA